MDKAALLQRVDELKDLIEKDGIKGMILIALGSDSTVHSVTEGLTYLQTLGLLEMQKQTVHEFYQEGAFDEEGEEE